MKDGFILYKKMYEPIRSYANAEKGELLDAIFQYQISGQLPSNLSEKVKIAFEFFRVQMDMDDTKYTAKCAKNKEVAEKRWNNTNACERIQTDANDADKDKDKEKKKDKDINIPFDDFWNLYDKKVGREKSEKKWLALTDEQRVQIMEYIPKYKKAQPDKQYRKNPETFFNNKSWNDELPLSQTQENKPQSSGYVSPKSSIARP